VIRFAFLLLIGVPAFAVELHIQFAALERILTGQLFTQEGRRYVRGDQNKKCNFAYLEKPHVEGENGRLRIRARFSGRSSLNIAGRCVGVGDAFDLVILATPQYKDGALRLQGVKVTSDGKTGFYIRRVCESLEASLARDFRYPLEVEARKTLEAPGREMRRFQVPDIRVSEDALVLTVDFELTVK
jgi:hypothetical protein